MPASLDCAKIEQYHSFFKLFQQSSQRVMAEPTLDHSSDHSYLKVLPIDNMGPEAIQKLLNAVATDAKYTAYLDKESVSKVVFYLKSIIYKSNFPSLQWYKPALLDDPVGSVCRLGFSLAFGGSAILPRNDFTTLLISPISDLEIDPVDTDSPLTFQNINIVFDGSDVHAVTDTVVSNMKPRQKWSTCYVLLQESCCTEFEEQLIRKIKNATDSGKLYDAGSENIKDVSAECLKSGAKVSTVGSTLIIHGYLPRIRIDPASRIICLLPFRSPSEAVKLSRSLPHFCIASIWGADLSIMQSVGDALDCFTIGINREPEILAILPTCYSCQSPEGSFKSKKPLDIRDSMIKISNLSSMKPYLDVVYRWMTVEEFAIPRSIGVTCKAVGSVGKIVIYGNSVAKILELCLAALACGNPVEIVIPTDPTPGNEGLEQIVKDLQSVFPEGAISYDLIDSLEVHNVVFADQEFLSIYTPKYMPCNHGFRDDSFPDKNMLISSFISFKFVWMPETVPL